MGLHEVSPPTYFLLRLVKSSVFFYDAAAVNCNSLFSVTGIFSAGGLVGRPLIGLLYTITCVIPLLLLPTYLFHRIIPSVHEPLIPSA